MLLNWSKIMFSVKYEMKKWEMPSQEEKNIYLNSRFFSRYHGNRSFKEFWWEQQAKEGWLQGRQFVTPIAGAKESDCVHTSIVIYSSLCTKSAKTQFFLFHHGPSNEGWVNAVLQPQCRDEGYCQELGIERLKKNTISNHTGGSGNQHNAAAACLWWLFSPSNLTLCCSANRPLSWQT